MTEKQVIPQDKPAKMSKREITIRGIENEGRIDVSTLTPKQREYFREISRNLNERDLSSVTSYGSDLQRAMDSYSNEFLSQQMSSKHGVESATLISNLLGELKEIDIDDLEAPGTFKKFCRRFPILRKFVTSVEQVKAKYNTIQKNIDGIVAKLEASRQIALRDNNLLEKQFENNREYVSQIEDLIIAGKLKSQEIGEEIEAMKSSGAYNEIEVSDLDEYKNALDKRVSDLLMLRYAFRQSLYQIRIIQRTNMMEANNTESQITMTIPLWKNQLSIAVSLYNQKQSLEVNKRVTDTTNEILRKNSEMMKTQAIEVAKQNQRSVIDIETLRKTTNDFVGTIEGVQRAQREGAQKREAAEAELLKLEKQIATLTSGVQESTTQIIAKELRDVKTIDIFEDEHTEEYIVGATAESY